MTSAEVLKELQSLSSPSIKKVLMNHGAPEPIYGVKVEDMKKTIVKKVKADHKLALELFDSGVYDAMYLAGLIAEPEKMTTQNLQHWADTTKSYALAEYTVAWVTAESPHAMELALKWIESDKELVATAGWSTLSSYVAITPDEKLDIPLFKKLADRVAKEIHSAPNRVRQAMNIYLISTAAYITSLTPHVFKLAEKIGTVTVDMGGTACKVPAIIPYVQKIEARGSLGKKKKMARC